MDRHRQAQVTSFNRVSAPSHGWLPGTSTGSEKSNEPRNTGSDNSQQAQSSGDPVPPEAAPGMCSQCWKQPRDVVLVPCGHMVYCSDCVREKGATLKGWCLLCLSTRHLLTTPQAAHPVLHRSRISGGSREAALLERFLRCALSALTIPATCCCIPAATCSSAETAQQALTALAAAPQSPRDRPSTRKEQDSLKRFSAHPCAGY